MDIETVGIEGGRTAAVSIIGVEISTIDAGGRMAQICYALRLVSGDYDLGARKLPSVEVERWLAEGAPLVREAFEWIKLQDGVTDRCLGFAAEFERAYEYGLAQASALAKGLRL